VKLFSKLFKVAQVALVGAQGCPDARALHLGSIPTLSGGADARVKLLP